MTNLVIMESITKKCSKCKKMLCVEIFGGNGKGECFKTCDVCREKEQAQKLKHKKKQEEENNLVLDNSNKNEFVRRVFAYAETQSPIFKINLEKPEDGYCFAISYTTHRKLSIKHGAVWGDIKKALEDDLSLMSLVLTIEDDTVCDKVNALLFIEKISEYVGEEAFSVISNHTAALKGYSINFKERGHKMFLAIGDTWKKTQKCLDLPAQAEITCPICFDVLSSKTNSAALTCHECLASVCGDCTIKQFIVNQGVMICCSCRHTIGLPKPDYQVLGMVEVMRQGLACGLKNF